MFHDKWAACSLSRLPPSLSYTMSGFFTRGNQSSSDDDSDSSDEESLISSDDEEQINGADKKVASGGKKDMHKMFLKKGAGDDSSSDEDSDEDSDASDEEGPVKPVSRAPSFPPLTSANPRSAERTSQRIPQGRRIIRRGIRLG